MYPWCLVIDRKVCTELEQSLTVLDTFLPLGWPCLDP